MVQGARGGFLFCGIRTLKISGHEGGRGRVFEPYPNRLKESRTGSGAI
jgi:hypothetical protein